jgi:hypothetical protein
MEIVGQLEYQRVDNLPPRCIALRLHRLVIEHQQQQDQQKRNGIMSAASHGHRATAQLDDRISPCVFVEITHVFTELTTTAGTRPIRLTHCGC